MHNELTERLRDGRSKQPPQHHTNLCMVWYCGTSKRFVNEYGNKIKSYLFAHARSVRNAILPDGDGFIFIIILYIYMQSFRMRARSENGWRPHMPMRNVLFNSRAWNLIFVLLLLFCRWRRSVVVALAHTTHTHKQTHMACHELVCSCINEWANDFVFLISIYLFAVEHILIATCISCCAN